MLYHCYAPPSQIGGGGDFEVAFAEILLHTRTIYVVLKIDERDCPCKIAPPYYAPPSTNLGGRGINFGAKSVFVLCYSRYLSAVGSHRLNCHTSKLASLRRNKMRNELYRL